MPKTREEKITSLQENPNISVLVVGAGINGIGTFRDLAAQGIDVVMVDKGDYCSGASAASSHMLHGGLRYLENGEFRLVREALHERDRMLRNAPHYAVPAPTTIPIFRYFSGMLNAPLKFLNLLDRPSERGAFVIKIGLSFYDLFTYSRNRAVPTHKFAGRDAALKKRPNLNPDIVATATYYDAWMPTPERICLDLIRDTEAMSDDALALNYMALDGAAGDAVTLKDCLTDQTYEIKPRIVVNAAGPWIDFANNAMNKQTNFIGGTKGSHLVVDHPDLYEATQGHEMFFENEDGRIVLFFPFGDKVMMGTTDIPVENPDEIACDDEEMEYILDLVRKVFPSIKLGREHIVFTFSGVRPLPAMDANSTGQISRDHSIRVTQPSDGINFPVYSMVSGKWTTFRAFAEQTTDKILERLRKERKTTTEDMAIGGGKDYPKDDKAKAAWVKNLAKNHNLSESRAQTLFKRYGTYAEAVAAYIAQDEDKPLDNHAGFSQREVMFIAQNEDVRHVDDFIMRRSLIGMYGETSLALVQELTTIIGAVRGWSEAEQQAEIDRTKVLFEKLYRVDLEKDALVSV